MFNVGKPVTGKNFFDRTKISKRVMQYIIGKQDFMIKAPRRYGKTSLLKNSLLKITTLQLFIDFRKSPRLETISNEILDFAYGLAGINSFIKSFTKNAMSLLIQSKKTLKIKNDFFEYSMEFLTKENEPFELFLHSLEVLNKISVELELDIILIMDEFQDIKRFSTKEIDILEVLRGEIQHHENITYCFLGSIESIMTDIFENKKSSFYSFSRTLTLEPFESTELLEDVLEAFKTKGIIFKNRNDLLEIFGKTSGHPTNTMLVMQNIYYKSLEDANKVINRKNINDAYIDNNDLIEQCIVEINSKKHYFDVLYRLVNDEKQILSAPALGQIYKGLMNMGYIDHVDRGKYLIFDGFLNEYLLRIKNSSIEID